jgi:hypothetical protein
LLVSGRRPNRIVRDRIRLDLELISNEAQHFEDDRLAGMSQRRFGMAFSQLSDIFLFDSK